MKEGMGVILIFFICLIIILLFIVNIGFIQPTLVANDIRGRITVVEPYDEITGISLYEKGYNWWSVVVSVMDVDTGKSSFDVVNYNRETKMFHGNVSKIKIL